MSRRDRGKQLNTVAMLARTEEERTARELQSRQATRRRDDQQLDQLKTFQSEYEQRLQQMAASGMPARQLADFRQFLANLNRAVESQSVSAAESTEAAHAKRSEWVDKASRRAGLDDFLVRYRAQERRGAERVEEKRAHDEHSARGRSSPEDGSD
ncbi:MAG: flagellar export protein FliJ [Chromatocurvus sp.]